MGVNVQIIGVWTFPGGEKKVYSDGATSISCLKNTKYFHSSGDKAENIKHSFCSVISPDRSSNNEMMDKAYSTPNYKSSCPCKYKELEVDFEGMNMDLVITESKLSKYIQENFICQFTYEIGISYVKSRISYVK